MISMNSMNFTSLYIYIKKKWRERGERERSSNCQQIQKVNRLQQISVEFQRATTLKSSPIKQQKATLSLLFNRGEACRYTVY